MSYPMKCIDGTWLLIFLTFVTVASKGQQQQAYISKDSHTISSLTSHGPFIHSISSFTVKVNKLRGGSTRVAELPTRDRSIFKESNEDTDESENEEKKNILRYRMEQQHLMQLRSTFLSEALSSKGIKVGPNLLDVSTTEAERPPQIVDWCCSLSTLRDPKTCLYSFDAEPNTKVIAPLDTTQYISLRALNRLRRSDPSKIEPMWHSKYAILQSWFQEDSEYSLLQYVGFKGYLISHVLLDSRGLVLKCLLLLGIFTCSLLLLPILEYILASVLVSKPFWDKWPHWARFAHAALPLKLVLGQMVWQLVAGLFTKLESRVKEALIDVECSILEESIPVTEEGDQTSSNDEVEYGITML